MIATYSITAETQTALQWFATHEPVSWFGSDAPCEGMRQRLKKRGLIETTTDSRRELPTYQLSEFAKLLLREATIL